jgi:hypothetical protein
MAGVVREAAARLLQRPRLDWCRLRPSSATAAQRCHSTLPHSENGADPYRFTPLHDAPPRPHRTLPLSPTQKGSGALRLLRFPRAALEALPFARRQLARVKRPQFEAVVQIMPRKPPVPWLPRLPRRETHEARHLRAAEPADSQPPALHVVFLTPKRVLGNSACVRDRGRTRMKEAMRVALLGGTGAALAGEARSPNRRGAAADRHLRPDHLLLVTPTATALTDPMPRLIADATTALQTLEQKLLRTKPAASPQRPKARQAAGSESRTTKGAAPSSGQRQSHGPADKTQLGPRPARDTGAKAAGKQKRERASDASYKWQ